jgi:DNA-binding response OmpR family regulator
MTRGGALVVEDDEGILNLIVTVLRRQGFDVVGVRDGREALDLLRADDRFVVIVLDLVLPHVGGAEVIAYLRQQMPATLRRVVVITAAPKSRVEGISEEICVVLRKPFDLEAFIRAVQSCAA